MKKQWGFTYSIPYGEVCSWASDITEEEEKIIKKAIKDGTPLEDVEELQPLLERATEEICEWETEENADFYEEYECCSVDDIRVEFCDPNDDDYEALSEIFDDSIWEDFSLYFKGDEEE